MLKTKNLLRISLISMLWVQISWSKPELDLAFILEGKDVCLLQTRNLKSESKPADSSLSASKQLFDFALNEIQNQALEYVQMAKMITANLLKHPDISNSESSKILEFKQNLTEFENKYNACNGRKELFELVKLYSNTTMLYLKSDEASFDEDDKKIGELLREYAANALDDKALKDLEKFSIKFSIKFGDLKEGLVNEESEIGKKILDWYQHHETLSDTRDKGKSFAEFISLFENKNDN